MRGGEGTHDFSCPVPGGGDEKVLLRVGPVDRVDLARVLLPGADREVLNVLAALCIWRRAVGSKGRPTLSMTSQSLSEPSPEAVTSWFSCTSDHATSKSPSCES